MRRFSRLTRQEEKRSIRQAVFFGGLTFILALGLLFLGVPALIKMAIFLGNNHTSSTSTESKNTLPPSPPILKPLPEATNSAQLVISGSAEPESTVKIFLASEEKGEVVTNNDGSFTFNNLQLNLGNNEVYALAIDKTNNTSAVSEKMIVFYKNTPPVLEISQPNGNITISQDSNRFEIVGKTDPEATILINDHLVVVDKDGNFKYPLILSSGVNNIKVLATDKAGNQTEKDLTITYSL